MTRLGAIAARFNPGRWIRRRVCPIAGYGCARIYLVPGFFGFTSLGALNYFQGVADHLRDALKKRGVDAELVECRTLPTASIRSRAISLYRQVLGTGGLDADHLHFVGHSTGGLDVRLLVTPGVRLLEDGREEDIGARTRSVVTVSTPHFGTPLAGFFTTVEGGHLLRLLTIVASSTEGRYTLWAASQLLALLARYDDAFGRRNTFLDAVSKALLSRVQLGADDPVWEFLREVAADQGGIIQLTQESMHLYNAAVTDRPGVRYGSVVTAAPPLFAHRLEEVLGVRKAASVAVMPCSTPSPAGSTATTPTPARRRRWPTPSRGAALPISRATNDAVVPTLRSSTGAPRRGGRRPPGHRGQSAAPWGSPGRLAAVWLAPHRGSLAAAGGSPTASPRARGARATVHRIDGRRRRR